MAQGVICRVRAIRRASGIHLLIPIPNLPNLETMQGRSLPPRDSVRPRQSGVGFRFGT